jgi:phosphoribosylaminoimidazole-succinocarboxamide synthase
MATYQFKQQTGFYKGKVRDVYSIGEDKLVMVVSDRISAFDVILPRPIPFKGQVLNQTAAYFLNATKDIVRNWLQASPLPNVSLGIKCTTYPIEVVVRGYLAGHAWRTYNSGLRELCGISLPEGLKENDPLPTPIITPTTKAHEGHDEDISREQIIERGLLTAAAYDKLCTIALSLFARGQKMANERGLILVDTKYEFGHLNGEVILIDEIHTPDSSRYFYLENYEERQRKGEQQLQLSKEFVRQWLIENGFQGKEGQEVPAMSDAWVNEISARYIQLFEEVTGQKFEPKEMPSKEAVETIVNALY